MNTRGIGFRSMDRAEYVANSIDKQVQREKQGSQRIEELSKTLGYSIEDAVILQKGIRDQIEKKNVDNKSVVMWIEYCRNSMKNMEIDEASIGGMIARFVDARAKDNNKNIECKVYPVVIYRGYESPKNIDLIVDVNVDPSNTSSIAIPVTIKLKTSEDNSLTVSIDKMYKRSVNIVVPERVDNLEKDVQSGFLKEVSLAICEIVDDTYHNVHGCPSGLLQQNIAGDKDELITNAYGQPYNFNNTTPEKGREEFNNGSMIEKRSGDTIIRRSAIKKIK
jgi:predicted transcriptional regulator